MHGDGCCFLDMKKIGCTPTRPVTSSRPFWFNQQMAKIVAENKNMACSTTSLRRFERSHCNVNGAFVCEATKLGALTQTTVGWMEADKVSDLGYSKGPSRNMTRIFLQTSAPRCSASDLKNSSKHGNQHRDEFAAAALASLVVGNKS